MNPRVARACMREISSHNSKGLAEDPTSGKRRVRPESRTQARMHSRKRSRAVACDIAGGVSLGTL